jgi:hypothetical protein
MARQILTPDMTQTETVHIVSLQIMGELLECEGVLEHVRSQDEQPDLEAAKIEECALEIARLRDEAEVFLSAPYGPTIEIGFIPASKFTAAKHASFDYSKKPTGQALEALFESARELCREGIKSCVVDGKPYDGDIVDLLERNRALEQAAAAIRKYNTLDDSKKKA